MKKILFLFFFLTAGILAFSQTPDFSENIHIHVWSELDAYPESEEAKDTHSEIFAYSIERIKEISPFLINGMVYGWNFSYTPSDKLRNVEEYFEITPIASIDSNKSKITYKNPWIQDNLVHIWAEYERTADEIWSYRTWNSINIKKTQGTGKGAVSKGFAGIEEAAKNCMKDGVRNFYRPIIKNKPKEITGKIIISRSPNIGITEGMYSVKLDFFLETDRIIKYTQF